MKIYFSTTILTTSLLLANSSLAHNRDNDEKIFNEPRDAGGVQLALGVGNIMASLASFIYAPYAGRSEAVKIIQSQIYDAKLELEKIDYLDSKEDRDAKIKSNQAELESLEENKARNSEKKKLKLEKKIIDLEAKEVYSREELKGMREAAQVKINEARLKLVEEYDAHRVRHGKQKLIQRAFVVNGLLQIVDIFGRIYVWNYLYANPTFSPTATATWAFAKKLYKDED